MIDITDFCRTEGMYKMPAEVGELCYATNGSVAVRIKKEFVKETNFGNLQIIEIINQKIDSLKEGFEIEFDISKEEFSDICPHCKDGAITTDCPKCSGWGECECSECQQQKVCDECNGLGVHQRKCEECNGVAAREVFITPDFRISGVNARSIAKLENVKFRLMNHEEDYLKQIAYFSFTGGEGMVAGLIPGVTDNGR